MPSYFRFRFFGPPPPAPPPATVAADLDDFLAALVAALKADATLAGVVGGRIYPEHPPGSIGLQSSLCYQVISERRTYHLRGASGLPIARVRFTVRSQSFADCSAVRKRLRDRFDGFIGPIGTVGVAFCQFFDVVDQYKDPIPGADKGTYVRMIDLKFKFRESPPSLT